MSERKEELQQQVVEAIDLSKEISDEELQLLIHTVVLKKSKDIYISMKEKEILQKEIFNSIRRLDILQELIEDSSISEIMINGAKHIFIEQHGRIREWDKQFSTEQKLLQVVQQIVAGSNRIVNESNPIVDARLSDGSRVNVILPPVSLDGPVVTIRKFPEEAITMEKLITMGALSEEAADFLKNLVIAGYNIFVSGGTGSGKTTFLNALSNYIPVMERIITIEDSAELQIKNIKNIVRLEVRNANVEGKNAVSIRDLIKASLRSRPDRIIIGEVRDAAAIDLLQGMNTGHNGMSTGHSNSSSDMLSRLETMVLLGADIPLAAVRKQIASAIEIIIQLGRLRDHSRRVLEIVELTGFENGEIKTNVLFSFEESGTEQEGKVIGGLKRTENPFMRTGKLLSRGIFAEDDKRYKKTGDDKAHP